MTFLVKKNIHIELFLTLIFHSCLQTIIIPIIVMLNFKRTSCLASYLLVLVLHFLFFQAMFCPFCVQDVTIVLTACLMAWIWTLQKISHYNENSFHFLISIFHLSWDCLIKENIKYPGKWKIIGVVRRCPFATLDFSFNFKHAILKLRSAFANCLT